MSAEVDADLAKDHALVCAAGDSLAAAAARVCSEYDGVHRLRAALSEWFTVRSHRSPSAAGGTAPTDQQAKFVDLEACAVCGRSQHSREHIRSRCPGAPTDPPSLAEPMTDEEWRPFADALSIDDSTPTDPKEAKP